MREQLYKVLAADRTSCYGGDATWTPGEWMPAVEGHLEPCVNGYHLCRPDDLVLWLGETIWTAEYRGDRVDCDEPGESKVVVRQARILEPVTAWNERTERLFACDCAERVLPIFEMTYPTDARPRQAIEVALRYANGQATDEKLYAARHAASAPAWDAARDAAWAAAWDAAWAAARDAASAAAWAASRAASRDAAWDAARDAESRWQTERLFHYLELH